MATSASGFPTQIMFLTLRALRCLFCPALKEYDSLRQNLYDKQAAVNEGRASPTEQDNYEKKFTQLLCYNTVLLHPAFLPSFWRFIRLVVTWLAWAMLSVNDDKTAEAQSLITSDDKRLLLSDSSDHVASVLHKVTQSIECLELFCFISSRWLCQYPNAGCCIARRGAIERLAYFSATLLRIRRSCRSYSVFLNASCRSIK